MDRRNFLKAAAAAGATSVVAPYIWTSQQASAQSANDGFGVLAVGVLDVTEEVGVREIDEGDEDEIVLLPRVLDVGLRSSPQATAKTAMASIAQIVRPHL